MPQLNREPLIFRMISTSEPWKPHKLQRDDLGGCYNREGYTPLVQCCLLDATDKIKDLLRNRVDPNELDQHGMAPLHYMALEGSEDIFKLLLNKGANLNLQDNKGKVALHHACEKGCLSLIKLILEINPTVDVKDNYGRTPLDLAKEKNHTEVVKILERVGKGNVDTVSENYEDCEPFQHSQMIKDLMKTIRSLEERLKSHEDRLRQQESTAQNLESRTSKMYDHLFRDKNPDRPVPPKPCSLPPKLSPKPDVKPRQVKSEDFQYEATLREKEQTTGQSYTGLQTTPGDVYENVDTSRYAVYHDTVVKEDSAQENLTPEEEDIIQENFKDILRSFEIDSVRTELFTYKFLPLPLMKDWRSRKVTSEFVIEHIILEEVLNHPRSRLEKLRQILREAGHSKAVDLLTPKG